MRFILSVMMAVAGLGMGWATAVGAQPEPFGMAAPKLELFDPKLGTNLAPALADSSVVAAPSTNTVPVAMPSAPDPIRVFLREGSFHMRVGNGELAAESFQKALSLEPTNSLALFGLGTIYITMKRYGEAEQVLKRLIEADPKNYVGRNNLAWMYARAEDPKYRSGTQSVRLSQECLLINDGDYNVWCTLAEGYYVSGQYDKALRAAEMALKLASQPNVNPDARQECEAIVSRCRKAIGSSSILE